MITRLDAAGLGSLVLTAMIALGTFGHALVTADPTVPAAASPATQLSTAPAAEVESRDDVALPVNDNPPHTRGRSGRGRHDHHPTASLP